MLSRNSENDGPSASVPLPWPVARLLLRLPEAAEAIAGDTRLPGAAAPPVGGASTTSDSFSSSHSRLVGRVGVGERVVAGDAPRPHQPNQRLFEGVRAGRETLLHRFLDLGDAALFDQFGNVPRVQQHLDRRHPGAVDGAHQTLRDDRLQRGGQVGKQHPAVLGRVEADDAVERVVGVVRVQRRQHQVARLSVGDRVGHGRGVADLADQDAVGRLAHRVLERDLERIRCRCRSGAG